MYLSVLPRGEIYLQVLDFVKNRPVAPGEAAPDKRGVVIHDIGVWPI